MKRLLTIISLIYVTACNNNEIANQDTSSNKSSDNTSDTLKYKAPKDSIDVEFLPIYTANTTTSSKQGPVFQTLIDSLLKYKQIAALIRDSSASIYILNEIKDGADTTSKTRGFSSKNISAAICNFDKSACYLNLHFDYSTKTIIVLNTCNDQDSLPLNVWDKKNCW